MGLHGAFMHAIRRWAARRHGIDRLPHRVTRRRIYIVPTRSGALLAALLFAMVIAALNYGSNLALGFAFLMASLAVVAMHQCHRNLLDIRVDATCATEALAGGRATVEFVLANAARQHRRDLEIHCESAEPVVFHLPASSTACERIELSCMRRGVLEVGHWELRTRHPFMWFRAWTYIHAPFRVYVAPAPSGRQQPPASARADTKPHTVQGGEDEFAGLRAYQSGDALKHMAWKVIARGGQPAVRQYAQGEVHPEWLDYESLPGFPSEQRLAQLCQWILERDALGTRYGLRLPGTLIAPSTGPAHRRACLRALAAFPAA